MSQHSIDRKTKREEAKLERQERAQREAQMLSNPVTEFANQEDISSRPNVLRGGNRLLTLLLFLAMCLLLLLALALGVGVYRNLVVHHSEQDALREEVSLISNSIRAFDTQDAVSVRKGPEGKALILTEKVGENTFEMRFYQYEGKVLQEYMLAENDFNPSAASVLFTSKKFNVTVRDRKVTVVTDAGVSRMTMRSAQGGDTQ